MNTSFSKSVFFTFLGFGILVISNLVFNIFSARYLGPSLYGEFNSFFYFLLAFSQPNNSFQLSVAKLTIHDEKENIIFSILIIGILFFILIFSIFPFVFNFYGINKLEYSFWGAFIVFLWFILAGMRGILQGRFHFFSFGFNIGFEGMVRFFSLLLFFYVFRMDVLGAILSSVVAGIFAFIVILPKLNLNLKNNRFNFLLLKEIFYAFSFLLPFGIIFQIDFTLAQNLFSREEIGYLSAAGLYGKNLVILSMLLANVVFSYILKSENKYFLKGIFISFLLFFLAYIFAIFFGKYLILFVQGSDYLKTATFLPTYIIFSFSIAFMQQLINFAYAKKVNFIPYILILCMLVSFSVFHFITVKTINIFLILLSICIFIFDFLILFLLRKKILFDFLGKHY